MSSRQITLSASAERSFDDVCWILERHAGDLLAVASGSAVDEASRLVDGDGVDVPHFDREARPRITVEELSSTRANQLTVAVRWAGDASRRFLPNVEARIVCSPAARRPVTRIELVAVHTPSAPTRRHKLEFIARRIVRSTLSEFLARLVDELERFEEHALA